MRRAGPHPVAAFALAAALALPALAIALGERLWQTVSRPAIP